MNNITTINTKNLLKPQISHVQTLVNSVRENGFAVDLSETGTGKTYSASAVAREINVPMFVICPKVVIPEWKKVSKIFGVKPLAVKNYESLIKANKKSHYTSLVKEKSPDGKEQLFKKLRFNGRVPSNTLFVFDEVHRCKGVDSTTADLLTTIRDQGFKVLTVSASAATNPCEMKALGYVTHLHHTSDHNKFKRTFAKQMGAEWNKAHGGMIFDPQSEKAREGMKYIHDYFFEEKKCGSRLTTDDMKSYFPENHVMADAIDCGNNTNKINKVYDVMERELAMLDERTSGYKPHIFSIMMKARRRSELLKVPTYVNRIEEAMRDNKSVVIFLNFNESIESCKARLEKIYGTKKSIRAIGEVKISTIKGGQSAEARQQGIDDFQNDTAQIMIANLAAGGTGVSLHDLNGNRPRVSFISPSFSAIHLLQALGRIYRANGKSVCQQHILFAADTIEEKACKRVAARLSCLSMMNTGDLTEGVQLDMPQDIDWEKAA